MFCYLLTPINLQIWLRYSKWHKHRHDMKSLDIPPVAAANSESIELLRMWAFPHVGQQLILRHDVWKDAAAWGLALADVARHIARAHAQEGKDEEQVFRRIVAGFQVEVDHPTDKPSGGIT
jgi:hypothetical protein